METGLCTYVLMAIRYRKCGYWTLYLHVNGDQIQEVWRPDSVLTCFFCFFCLYILLYSQQILTPRVFKIEGTITIERSRHVLKLNMYLHVNSDQIQEVWILDSICMY